MYVFFEKSDFDLGSDFEVLFFFETAVVAILTTNRGLGYKYSCMKLIRSWCLALFKKASVKF